MKAKMISFILISIMLIITLNCYHEEDSFQDIVESQLQRYPQMQIEDLYKLVHQAAVGNIHLGIDSTILKDYLIREMEKVIASDKEPLVEDLSPTGLVRVNLRPFKAKGGNVRELFEAMMQTAQTFQPDRGKITQYWKVIDKMAKGNSIPFNKTELDSFLNKIRLADFPAIHHSKEYSEAYDPAYRVILQRYLPGPKQH